MEGLKGLGEEFRLYSMMNWTQINSSLAPKADIWKLSLNFLKNRFFSSSRSWPVRVT